MEQSQSDRVHFGSIEAEERRRNQTRMAVDQDDSSGINLEDLCKFKSSAEMLVPFKLEWRCIVCPPEEATPCF
jgi:hypothetical protein